jgi:threonine dehydrogenase-like Zn-dependent dehydrogenase
VRAVVFQAAGQVRVADVPDPVLIAPTDAIVRISRTAICGSDLHFFHLKAPVAPGDVLGHEGMGVVEQVGSAVRNVRAGERVVVAFQVACGSCWFCQRGQTSLCETSATFGAGIFGGDLSGTQAEMVRVPMADVNLLPAPDGVDDERALFVGDLLPTGICAAALGDAGLGETVAIVGAGPIGLACAMAVRARSQAHPVMLERDDARLALAAQLGFATLDVREQHPVTALETLTEGRGADVVLEAVGTPAAYGTAIDIVRRGGRVVVAGMYAGEVTEIQLGVYWARMLDVRFTGICPVHAWWQQAMDEVAAGRIDPEPIVSHRLPLEDAPEAYERFDRREATKVVLTP